MATKKPTKAKSGKANSKKATVKKTAKPVVKKAKTATKPKPKKVVASAKKPVKAAKKAASKPAKPIRKAVNTAVVKAKSAPVKAKTAPKTKKMGKAVSKAKTVVPIKQVPATKKTVFAKPSAASKPAGVSRPAAAVPVVQKPVAAVETQHTKHTEKTVQKTTSTKTRFSDAELQEFKELILHKLEDARAELQNLNSAIISANENGTDDTGASFKMLEDGSDTLAKEEAAQLAARQKKFIEQLEAALIRIENKTYGICRVTGQLIAKERLRAVPHTTQSIEAKLKQYKS